MKKLFLGVLVTLCMISCNNVNLERHESLSTSENAELVVYSTTPGNSKGLMIYYCRPIIGNKLRETTSISFLSTSGKYKTGDRLKWTIEK